MSYTSVFGGNTIYPSNVSYLSIALSADTPLEWPLESSGTEDPAARIIDVDPTASGFSIVLPDATLTGAGQTILFNNIDGTHSFFVKDYAGNTLATVTAGTQWQVYLAATTTAAGTWRVFRYGASTATVQPSALAGFGLTVTGSTLSQSLPVTTFSTTGTTVATSNRASAFVWNATGSGTLNLLTAVSAGNNFFVFVRNEGGGDLTVDPAGSETINSAPNLVLRPGDSATLITDGVNWYTIGLGQEAVFAFDYTSISVTGGTVTLSGSQLNRIAYKFVGTLTSDCTVVVPATIQQYWINNATTGAFTLSFKTSSGAPTQVNQGAKGIYYCDGTNIVLGSDPTTLTTPIVISDGGTGATTASGARLNLGITAFADAIVTATTGASVRTTIGAAALGANSDITSLSGLTTPLSIAQGGTGANTASGARTSLGLGTMSTQNANAVAITGGSVTGITDLAIADGGTGASDAAGARTNLGLGSLAVLSSINNSNWSGTALAVANGGTGATDAATARSNLGAGTVTSVAGTGTVNGLTLTGTVTSSGSLTLGGTLSGVNLTTQVTGTLPIGNGGTGATTAAGARTALGATTLGGNIFTITNPSAVTFPRFNADNTVSALSAEDFRTAIGAGSGGGSVTSVSGTGTVNGITLTGTVTSSGSLTLGGTLSGVSLTTQVTGTLPIANGGTGATTAANARTALSVPSTTGSGASGTWGISISGSAATANALNTGNTYTAVGYVSTASAGTALQVGDSSGIRNFGNGSTIYIDVAGGSASAGSIVLRNTSSFTSMATFSGSGTQLTSLGVGTAPSGTTGEIRATNNVTAYYSSDARLKENVQPIADALGIVSAVGGKTFDWTDAYIADHGGEDGYFVRKSDFGVIAQDVEAVFPLAVRTREDGTKAVDYEKLVAVAFAAIKELRDEVAELRAQAVKVVKP